MDNKTRQISPALKEETIAKLDSLAKKHRRSRANMLEVLIEEAAQEAAEQWLLKTKA